jgi:hypothetical protein
MCKRYICILVVSFSILTMGGTYSLAQAPNAPVAIGCNVTVPAGKGMVAHVTAVDIDCGSFDPDGEAITLSLDPAGPYAIGDTDVTLTATDASGNAHSTIAVVTVLPTAYSTKEEAIKILNGLVGPSGDNPNDPIQLAINQLVAGIDNRACWVGPDRIAPGQGQANGTDPFVCDQAAIDLLDATDPDQAKAIDLIVAANKIICDTAITDAAFQGSDVTEAKALRNEGGVARTLALSSVAVAKYAEAWAKATEGPQAPAVVVAEAPTPDPEPEPEPEPEPVHIPETCTYSPRQIANTSAVFWGCLVDDGGEPCKWRFIYKIEGGPEIKTAWQNPVVEPKVVYLRIHDLSPDTTYYYALQAKNQAGMGEPDYSPKGIFKTLP